mgnify:CR=1 FL=1
MGDRGKLAELLEDRLVEASAREDRLLDELSEAREGVERRGVATLLQGHALAPFEAVLRLDTFCTNLHRDIDARALVKERVYPLSRDVLLLR